MTFNDSDEEFSEDEKSPNRKKFYQYRIRWSHSAYECTTLKSLSKKIKSIRFTGIQERK